MKIRADASLMAFPLRLRSHNRETYKLTERQITRPLSHSSTQPPPLPEFPEPGSTAGRENLLKLTSGFGNKWVGLKSRAVSQRPGQGLREPVGATTLHPEEEVRKVQASDQGVS